MFYCNYSLLIINSKLKMDPPANELGMQYDNAIRGSFDAGSISRRSSVSPRK